MGYTHFTVSLIEPHLKDVRSVMDLGAQNDYRVPLPAPYISEWYKSKGIKYECVDLSQENAAIVLDLSDVHEWDSYDLVVDAGTSEHVGKNGKFSWEGIYNCWKNKHEMLKIRGIMVNENPKTGNWKGHGFQYYTQDFYTNLAEWYDIIGIGEHPAMGNTTDGWNVWCVMRKVSEDFPTLAQFKKLGLEKQ